MNARMDRAPYLEVDKKAIKALEEVLTVDLPAVMKQFDNPF